MIKSRLVLFFNLIGSESGASFLDQWVNEVKRNQSSPGSLSTLNRKLHMLWKQQWFPLNSAVPNQCFDWNRKRWPWVWNEFFVQLLLYDWSISHKCPVNHSRTVLIKRSFSWKSVQAIRTAIISTLHAIRGFANAKMSSFGTDRRASLVSAYHVAWKFSLF